jgi:hypothetical protein
VLTGRDRKEARLSEIDRKAAAMRTELGQLVVAVEPFSGSLPGGRVFSVRAGHSLRSDDAVVGRYRSRFRPLAEREINNRVKGWVQRSRSAWGVG